MSSPEVSTILFQSPRTSHLPLYKFYRSLTFSRTQASRTGSTHKEGAVTKLKSTLVPSSPSAPSDPHSHGLLSGYRLHSFDILFSNHPSMFSYQKITRIRPPCRFNLLVRLVTRLFLAGAFCSVLKALEEYAASSQRMLLFGAFIGHANVAPPLPPGQCEGIQGLLLRLIALVERVGNLVARMLVLDRRSFMACTTAVATQLLRLATVQSYPEFKMTFTLDGLVSKVMSFEWNLGGPYGVTRAEMSFSRLCVRRASLSCSKIFIFSGSRSFPHCLVMHHDLLLHVAQSGGHPEPTFPNKTHSES